MVRIVQADANPIAIFPAGFDVRVGIADELILGGRVRLSVCITVSAGAFFATATVTAGAEAAGHAAARHSAAHRSTHRASTGHSAGAAWHHSRAAHHSGASFTAAGHATDSSDAGPSQR